MKVFIADESISFRSVLANSLKDLTGAEVVGHTDDCNEAVQAIRELQPDVVILNLRLKSGTGINVLEGIRKRRNASPVAIMLTNYPYNPYQKMQLSHGAEYFLHKASQFSEIISIVKDLTATKNRSNSAWVSVGGRMCYN